MTYTSNNDFDLHTHRPHTIVKSSAQGSASSVLVAEEGYNSQADVYLKVTDGGSSMSNEDAFKIIQALVEYSGIRSTTSFNGDLVLSPPRSKLVEKRRDGISQKFWGYDYKDLSRPNQVIANRIVDLEIKAGELK